MTLPADHHAHVQSLEDAYLQHDDPILQSGFGGGTERWREEREPILDAIEGDGDLLDIGCANGYLLRCLVDWGVERGLSLTPHGIDVGRRLIELAKRMHPKHAANLHMANGWDWRPDRRFRYVYTLYDCVPEPMLVPHVRRLLRRVVEPGGRLIIGAYGSRSRGEPPFPIADRLVEAGLAVAGSSLAGSPPIVAFAWLNNN
ncbi:MAG TPA: methyltransferase domain-containing protein [Dehalococcoidia bacterium]|nr:methyltransferase domain-containing protein [Dehalococcoidia bacterium]